ncbi:MAG: tetratricopeptide repeat protein [Gammaproteobacteria bacterium]|nr:tetratricopeptide repeat protein [Gammaproteobacteria bacterium]
MTRCTDVLSMAMAAVLLTACSSAPVRKPAPLRASKPASPPPLAVAAPALAPSASGKPPADERFRNALGLMADHRPQEAQAALQSLLKDYPDLSGPLTDAGILYARAGQRDKAMAHFARAIQANPANVVALNWNGALVRDSGDFTRAEALWRQALAVQPDYPAALLNLAILYDVSMHRPQDALTCYRRYLALIGKDDLIVSAWVRELEGRSSQMAAAGAEGVAR